MNRKLLNGPLAGRRLIQLSDPPPPLRRIEELHPDDQELERVGEGGQYPESRWRTYLYQLSTVEQVLAPHHPAGCYQVALYTYAHGVDQAA